MANIYTPPAPQVLKGGAPPAIVKGVPNPMTQIASDVRNSLYGKGSLGSGSTHIGSIQNNIARAISVSNAFSNKPAQSSLLDAQKYMTAASSAKDATTRATYLAQAKQSLITANNEMSGLGHGKAIGQVSPNTHNQRVL